MNRLYLHTSLIQSLEISPLQKVYLKMESAQPSGSFKNRGIGELCFSLADRVERFVSSSGGNAGLAVAYSGRFLKKKVTVVIPTTTKALMIDKIKREGAEVIIEGNDWNAADKLARALAEQPGNAYIPPFDHPTIWKGHASIIHELKKDLEGKPDAIAVAVGGGGLLCGVLQGLHEVGWKDVPVFTAETEGTASFAKSVAAGHLVTLDAVQGIATSLGAKRVTQQALDWTQQHTVYPVVVSDREALQACMLFSDQHRVLVEPACGAALSLVYGNKLNADKYKKVVVIVCGGCGVTRDLLEQWNRSLKERY